MKESIEAKCVNESDFWGPLPRLNSLNSQTLLKSVRKMSGKYTERKDLNLPQLAEEVWAWWEENQVFERSVSEREGCEPFVFYEGPPSANGMPGIHHVLSRSLKDIFCRYKTLKGYQVKRKAGWDTHGLPVELGVEKELGITKKDIGTKITVAEYNQACRKAVMRYTDIWNDLTRKMGYWVDLSDPYITYENKYIETVWWLLRRLHQKDMLYKGKSIQPYSPAAGTGLSSHELNMPGCYRNVKDVTATAQFHVEERSMDKVKALLNEGETLDGAATCMVAWTTTPWTLPSNSALAVGPKVDYVVVKTFNQYTGDAVNVVLAEALVGKVMAGKFVPESEELTLAGWSSEDKKIPYRVIGKGKGSDLIGLHYHQLLPFVQPLYDAENAFQVIAGDFVTTEDGTGVVHIAPTFGADDARVAKAAGIPPITVLDDNEEEVPLVDLEGRFVAEMGEMAGRYVKDEYYKPGEALEYSTDVALVIKLKQENKAFRSEKYEHNYPHCWRTDKPVLYYPLDSWFVRAPEARERMMELNNTINWKPAETGTKRFGNWLENALDWNLSRSRYWGIPLPIWRTEDGDEVKCIGSAEDLKTEVEKAIAAGLMSTNPLADFTPGDMSDENYNVFDLHKPMVDDIILVSDRGLPMEREKDLIDVWFDSGSMPYAQWHYPFENKEMIDEGKAFPADYIAEGVDQTRGWFYTLHAIGTMCFDSVAYKNVISNGLVLDKNGEKMSKRKGNVVDPFETIGLYGPDATRWYMISNAAPWDNLKFNFDYVDENGKRYDKREKGQEHLKLECGGIIESHRKFFGTLHNTYQFLAVYANIDGFTFEEDEIAVADRPELDRWILARLNSLIKEVDGLYADYEPTRAARVLQDFVIDQLSNWYVRLARRRFWKGSYGTDKISAYQTLYRCLEVVTQLASPIAPFYTEWLYGRLNSVTGRQKADSVHLSFFPEVDEAALDADLETRMEIAQKVTSVTHALRKKQKVRVRQPLQKLMVPALDETFARQIKGVEALILSEVNIKELEVMEDTSMLVKEIKANFRTLGQRLGKMMKSVAAGINAFSQEDIAQIEREGQFTLSVDGEEVVVTLEDVIITSQDIPGWTVGSEGGITVALDMTISDLLREEGVARELVNRIQNLRKSSGYEVTDRIKLEIKSHDEINAAINNNLDYICSETLADSLKIVDQPGLSGVEEVELEGQVQTVISIDRLN